MKIEEAKKLWCPMAANTKTLAMINGLMAVGEPRHQCLINTMMDELNENAALKGCEKCVADKCMWWVWELADSLEKAESEGHCGGAR